MDLTWAMSEPADPGESSNVADLAHACLSADGGMPLLLEEDLQRARFGGRVGIVAHNRAGRLVAVAAVQDGPTGQVTTSGLVHPDYRRRGLGTGLLCWARGVATGRPLVVQTECSSRAAEQLYAAHGLRQVFAETVMRHDLGVVADVRDLAVPDGVRAEPVERCDLADLYRAYLDSFADRPGFGHPTQDEWLQDLLDDDAWDRTLSTVLYDGSTPVGFINIVDNWIDQVGVAPSHRGRRLGALAVSDSLRGLRDRGATECWLTVEVDNPAGALYGNLGFDDYGKRARFA